jgi:protein SCO1/2
MSAVRRLLVVVAAVALAVGAIACGAGDREGKGTGRDGLAAAQGLPEGLAGKPAPRIALTDARTGARFDSASLAGRPYVVTFLYTNCPDVCPLIGQEIREALAQLGPDARRVAALAVSVDPRHDDAAAVRAWLRRQRQPANFHYLIGTEAELAPVWKAFYAAPQTPGDPESAHTAIVWLVDRDGRLAGKLDAGVPFEPAALARDLRALLAS